MRILLTADPMIPVPPRGYGGIERIVDALVREYCSDGHEVALVAHPESSSPSDVRFGWPGLQVASAFDTVRNALALRRAVRQFAPDIVHSFSRLAYLLPLLASSLPKVMSYQRHTGGVQISLAARLAGRSIVFTGCSDFICDMGRPGGGSWSSVPNFIELEKFTFVPRVADDAPLVFLSRIEAIKGPDLAIAVARASKRRLILAGNRPEIGPGRKLWEDRIAPQLGTGVEWIGEVGDAQKNQLLGQAAALIVPVQWDEPFGIVFAEALACGTPILSCRRGALPEIVDEGVTGLFLKTVEDGVAAVRRLSSLSRTACRSAAERRFSVKVCSAKYLALYREAVGSR